MNLVGLNRGGEDILGRTARAQVWRWEITWHVSGDSVETDLVPPPTHQGPNPSSATEGPSD